ncbi:hypothetical protein [Arthrobacter sp. 260]|uniref:hypothetical protein n=1 Tax=Arthrobacter sp. 260 TaxID=2735314 RepID=UPI0014924663|nr:hypothetical protein [Arthrobacter sp. 260]NOJ58426.1 hypothetical protein [Arthrobacter sp. 260]
MSDAPNLRLLVPANNEGNWSDYGRRRFQVVPSATTSNIANRMTRRQRSGSCE